MRRTLIAAAAVLPLTLGTAALAQNAAPPPPAAGPGPAEDAALPPPPRHAGPAWGVWHHRPGEAGRRAMPFDPRTFALFHPPANRQLTPADVQEIAQALLLWNGNHSWKVTDVQPAGDNRVGFTYAAPDGTAIAKFTVNTENGRIERVG
ncbi:MAG TPA: hypothetical protein VFA03_04750 [Acetobacteraceae bacterium]|nr:hypothetical protein [Acetobacteraceae bacterium]